MVSIVPEDPAPLHPYAAIVDLSQLADAGLFVQLATGMALVHEHVLPDAARCPRRPPIRAGLEAGTFVATWSN